MATIMKGKALGVKILNGIPTKKVKCDRCPRKRFYKQLHRDTRGDLLCEVCRE